MSVYMTLGELAVELLSAPTSFETRSTANYAEHQLIGRKSALQYVGHTPDDIVIAIRLHGIFTDPATEMQQLNDLKDNKTVFPLVFGSGEYKGTFVLKETSVSLTHTDGEGRIIALEASLSLAEYIGDPAEPNPPGVMDAGVKINLLSEPALPDPTSPEGLLATVQTALEVAGQVAEAAEKVNNIVATAQNGDILGAVALAGSSAPGLAEMAAQLPVEEFQDLETFTALATDTGNVARNLATTRDNLNTASGLLQQSPNLSGLLSASGSMSNAVSAVASAGPALARLDAHAQVGSRLAGVTP
ncbi:MAG: phage tail protein [Candidatus Sericytochromatia bacterium]|nr:phage tail protein [Candidatus Sericytochromatia bacterium]